MKPEDHATCPKCEIYIKIPDKPEFECPHCGAKLKVEKNRYGKTLTLNGEQPDNTKSNKSNGGERSE